MGMSTSVILPYESTLQALQWAKQNCSSYIDIYVHMDGFNNYDNSKIEYFFTDDPDALMFMLRWK